MPKDEEKQLNIPATPIRFIVYISKPFALSASVAIIAVIIASIVSQSTALVFKWVIEAVQHGDIDKALKLGLLFPAMVFGVQMLYRISGLAGLTWVIRVKKHIGDILFSYSIKHSHSYFSNRFAGSLLNKISNVIGAVDSIIMDFLWSYLATTVVLLTTLVYIYRVDAVSGYLFLGLIVSLLIVNNYFIKRKRLLSREVAAQSTIMRGTIVDVFSNISAVRQFTSQKSEETLLDELGHLWVEKGLKSMRHSEMVMAINGLILFCFSGSIFYVLTQRWGAGVITTADFIFILALISQITGTLIFIGRVMSHYARVRGELEEGLEELIVPHEIVDATGAVPLIATVGKVDWKNVGFEFGENKVFDDFNLTITSGQRVGLVGHSGAGKTTFVSLLLRQHDVTGGAIEIDGQNIAIVTQDSLRQNIAVVPQEPLLFHRTIKENIIYGNPDATDEDVIAVAKKAQAHDFIVALPEGYDTMVGERGIKLSGGQKQRVAIARAMLKNSPILVLDEATSALDSESEVAIQTALHQLMEGKTVVAIAHRLSTLREMDRIIVLENGKIVEDGTHDSLKEAGGVYQRLWEHQAGGFLVE
jgi:ATP-binding cassette, subfamily B, bacterial